MLARAIVTSLAVAAPMLLAFNAPPSPTVLNGLLSIGLWGIVLTTLRRQPRAPSGAAVTLLAAAVCVVLAALLSAVIGALPASIAAGSVASIGAASLVMLAAATASDRSDRKALSDGFWWGLVVAGVLSAAIAMIQVFAPDWPDGTWIARSSLPGRAGANLRQPNHLSSLVLWAMVAWLALAGGRRWRMPLVVLVQALLLFAVVLTGSRTGILGTAMLALWGLFDRRLPRPLRFTLGLSPLLFVLLWLAMVAWASLTGHLFGAEGHLALGGGAGDISSSRFAIWSNALSMIAHEPWAGVGWGEFNFAWTLSAFAHRPTAFFDHTHNLPLQLLVELGVPLGGLVIALLLVALVQAGRRAWAGEGDDGLARRAAFMIVLMIGLHSLLEYPLWYAYFLLPTAFAWGFALAPGQAAAETPSGLAAAIHNPRDSRTLAFAGLALAIGAAAAAFDYWRVVVIYDPGENAAPLEERIERGQRSPLFGQHADYAAATAFGEPRAPLSPSQQLAFRRAPHQLLDVRLMIAWAQALAAEGELDKARWLAARIREFRNPGADEFFAPCAQPAAAASAFQCQPPQRVVPWREFTLP
ncbi:MAG: hypothetical protein LKCHEGNO_03349 [Burkholderiaceae bacterium]|nr:hypothetical protein [Burkholderiaceae bacterium]